LIERHKFNFPTCPLTESVTFDNSETYIWQFDGKNEILTLSGTNKGSCFWNKNEEGCWSYDEFKKEIVIDRPSKSS
jgi:hypothetical protein